MVWQRLDMDFEIFLEYTFSQFQDKNISLTMRKKYIVAFTLTRTALSAALTAVLIALIIIIIIIVFIQSKDKNTYPKLQ